MLLECVKAPLFLPLRHFLLLAAPTAAKVLLRWLHAQATALPETPVIRAHHFLERILASRVCDLRIGQQTAKPESPKLPKDVLHRMPFLYLEALSLKSRKKLMNHVCVGQTTEKQPRGRHSSCGLLAQKRVREFLIHFDI
eukprot:scaffold2388_cov237-Pinguiococcus_pyrenoidosus.AAC.4